jgi:hypothetical protein
MPAPQFDDNSQEGQKLPHCFATSNEYAILANNDVLVVAPHSKTSCALREESINPCPPLSRHFTRIILQLCRENANIWQIMRGISIWVPYWISNPFSWVVLLRWILLNSLNGEFRHSFLPSFGLKGGYDSMNGSSHRTLNLLAHFGKAKLEPPWWGIRISIVLRNTMMTTPLELYSRTTSNQSPSVSMKSCVVPFPWKLHETLDNDQKEGFDSVVSWLPRNKNTFRVHDIHAFVETVMSQYFNQTK